MEREGKRITEAIGEEDLRDRKADIVRADFQDMPGIAFGRVERIMLQMENALRASGGARGIHHESGVVPAGRCRFQIRFLLSQPDGANKNTKPMAIALCGTATNAARARRNSAKPR